jgi:hypothetical protein
MYEETGIFSPCSYLKKDFCINENANSSVDIQILARNILDPNQRSCVSDRSICNLECPMPKRPTIETPTHSKGPGFKTPKSNRVSPTQIYIPTEFAAPSRKGKKRPLIVEEDDPPEGSPPHKLHHWKVRLECAIGYLIWTRSGSKKAESPFACWKEEFGVDRRDPARWLQKLNETGSVHDAWSGGRPLEYGKETKAAILDIATDRAHEQMRCSAAFVRKKMVQRGGSGKVPSVSTIAKLKRTMKFHIIKVVLHPTLSASMMAQRLVFARAWVSKDWSRVIVLDEKWFTEEKPGKPVLELPRGMAANDPSFPRHKAAPKETQTQYTKIMFLTAVCQWGRVMNILLDTTGHTKINKKGEEVPAKVDSAFLKPIWKKLMRAARKIPHLRTGKVYIMLDRASVHRSNVTLEAIKAAGFTVIDQPPRSPDFNLLDAFVFPAMERWCNELGAITKTEIEAAVAKCFAKVTPVMCKSAILKVKSNMEESIKLKGGNFYFE